MKHNLKITFVILGMFLLTQFIGLYVVNHYSPFKVVDGNVIERPAPELPFGMQPPEVRENGEFIQVLVSIILAFVIAITLIFFLTKFNVDFFIKLWFFVVIAIALGITLNAFIPKIQYQILIVLLITIPLAFVKIYKKNFLLHNLTELFIYPGIAAVFVPLLNVWTIIFLLILISIYDMWAVWHSGFMQKMAKYQINRLNVFSGFFVPYASKKTKQKIKLMREKAKTSKIAEKELKGKKFKVNVAILGGGDVIFPIITAGVMLKTFGLLSALFVIAGATIGLTYLFFNSEKKKFYPAMPFITTGIFLGLIAYWIAALVF